MSATTPAVSAPARLSRDTIVDAYARLADVEGPEAVSLRRLGAALGVDATAIYRHFRDKAELLEAVADLLLRQLADQYVPSGSWRADLRTLALEARAMYLGHPRLAHVIASSPEPLRANRRLTEHAVASLRNAGLPDREAAKAYEAFASYVAGASSLDAELGPQVGDAWRRAFAALDADEYPNVTAVAPYLYRDDPDGFLFGLEVLLDGIEARSQKGSGRPV